MVRWSPDHAAVSVTVTCFSRYAVRCLGALWVLQDWLQWLIPGLFDWEGPSSKKRNALFPLRWGVTPSGNLVPLLSPWWASVRLHERGTSAFAWCALATRERQAGCTVQHLPSALAAPHLFMPYLTESWWFFEGGAGWIIIVFFLAGPRRHEVTCPQSHMYNFWEVIDSSF